MFRSDLSQSLITMEFAMLAKKCISITAVMHAQVLSFQWPCCYSTQTLEVKRFIEPTLSNPNKSPAYYGDCYVRQEASLGFTSYNKSYPPDFLVLILPFGQKKPYWLIKNGIIWLKLSQTNKIWLFYVTCIYYCKSEVRTLFTRLNLPLARKAIFTRALRLQ